MIVSYPIVDDNGNEFGGEVSVKFAHITSIEKMYKWTFMRQQIDEPRQDERSVIPGCCSIAVGPHTFDIKVDYDEMLAKWKEHYEMYG